MIWSIYLIINHRNYKVYVGQTKRSVKKRLIAHCAKKRTVSSIHSALKKYGRDSFSIEVIDVAFSQNEANFKEETWIKSFKSADKKYGYNILEKTNGIKTFNKGKKFSEEHKKNMSLSMTPERKADLLALNIKEWVLISPDGKKFEISNLQNFCDNRRLDAGNMVKLTTSRKGNYYLGWQCFKKEDFSEKDVLPSKKKINCGDLSMDNVSFLMPNGQTIKVENIALFCKENNCDLSAIYKVIKGYKKHYKGITVYNPNSSN